MSAPNIVVTPDGRRFWAFTFHGSLSHWRGSLIEYFEQQQLPWGEISGDGFVVNDGKSVALADCQFLEKHRST